MENYESPIYARTGEWVTCLNNHRICQFMMDVYYDTEQNVDIHLGNWQQTPPKIGAPVSECICALCSEPFFKAPAVYHFEDGFREAIGEEETN